MFNARLLTASGDYVVTVQSQLLTARSETVKRLPFVDRHAPAVLIWGTRSFIKISGGQFFVEDGGYQENGPPALVYREVSMSAAVVVVHPFEVAMELGITCTSCGSAPAVATLDSRAHAAVCCACHDEAATARG